jgi:uncharacterized membrane protein YjjP (DUF1212 family)
MHPTETQAFLIKAGTLLHRYGTPSHRLERVMTKISQTLGVHGVFLYTPTALVISITDESGESTFLRRVDSGAIDIDKVLKFDETLERVEDGTLSVGQASQRLDEIERAQPPYPTWVSVIACAVSCSAVAIFFRGTPVEILAGGSLGLIVALLEILHAKLGWEQGFLEPISGFMAAIAALALAHFVIPVDDRLVTLAGLIVMIPGLKLTIALTELAVGHLSAGVARLAGACVSLLTITVGVAIGWRVAGTWRSLPAPGQWELPEWWQWVAIAVAPITFAIVFRARWPIWPTIAAVSVAGFATSFFCSPVFGIEVGAFCSALVVGVGSNLYARIRDRPAMVPLTPGIIVLVPGSLGYRSLTAFLDRDTMSGIDFAFSMMIVAVSLVGGILTANAVLPPKRIL